VRNKNQADNSARALRMNLIIFDILKKSSKEAIVRLATRFFQVLYF